MVNKKWLIDANEAVANTYKEVFCTESEQAWLRHFIIKQPTVDAVEVVHGEWISWEKADNFIPSPNRHECSVCHDAAQVLVNGLELFSPYCPNCGAKMDGDRNA